MNNACIIINNEYPKSHQEFNEEVQRDLVTIKETLADHRFIEMTIPVVAGLISARKLVQTALSVVHSGYATNCHIVLNTHGIPGKSDLRHEIVQMVVKHLSERNIAITQLSALLCAGMAPESIDAASKKYIMHSRAVPEKINLKAASMNVLHIRLNSMVTQIGQHFDIRGFDYEYSPDEARSEVIDVLRGQGGIVLSVTTIAYTPPVSEHYVHQIAHSISVIQQYCALDNPQEHKEYRSATNALGLVLASMKIKVLNYLNTDDEEQQLLLAPEHEPLWTAVQTYHRDIGITLPLDGRNFTCLYTKWLKEKKVYSLERIQVLSDHARIIYGGPSNTPEQKEEGGSTRGSSPPIKNALLPLPTGSSPEGLEIDLS